MNEEDYACDKFVGQRWKKDVCKICFQPKRLHKLKTKATKKGKIDNENTTTKKSTVAETVAETVASAALTSMISTDTKTIDKTDALASKKHIEPEQQQKEVNLELKGATVVPEEQLSANSQESRAIEHECSMSGVEPQASDKVLLDVNTDEQGTVDDLCAGSSTNVIVVKYDQETEHSTDVNSLDNDDKRDDNDRSVTEEHKTPLDNSDSDIRITDTSMCNTVEGSRGNGEGAHDDDIDGVVMVEHSNTSHVEELPTKPTSGGAGNEDIHKEATTSTLPPVEFTTGEEPSCSEEVPGESGFEGDIRATQVEDNHSITTNITTPTLLTSSLQDDAVLSLSAEKLQQLNAEETHADVVCDNDGAESPSAKVELPQSNDNDDVTSANDPAPPTLTAADNQAPPMVVNDHGFNIPVPPSPPPIRPPPPCPSLLADKEPSAGAGAHAGALKEPGAGLTTEMLTSLPDEERGKLLSDIRSGARLKHVPWPQEKKAGQFEITNVESELRHIVQQRRRKEVTDMVERLEVNKDKMDRLIKDILEAAKHAQRVVFLKVLQDQINQFLQTSQLSLEVLEKRCLNWPVQQVTALSDILDFMDKLEARVKNVEALCHNATVNPDAVQRCAFEVIKLAKECDASNSGTRFLLASSAIQVSQTDIDGLMLRASQALVPLLDKLYEKAFISYRAATDGSTNKFDLKFRLTNAQRLLKMCCSISDSAAMHLRIQRHVQYSEAQLKTKELQIEFNKLSQASEESSVDVSTTLKATEVPRNPDSLPRKTKEDYLYFQKIVKKIPTASLDELEVMLREVNAELYRINELQLIKAAISSKKVETVKCVACAKEKFDWDNNLKHVHDYDWLCEAVTMGFSACLEVLVKQCGVCVNAQSIERAQTALHVAARKPDFPVMLQLLKLGVDPLMVNSEHRTPLQLIAIKHFPFARSHATTEVKEFLFDLSEYLNNSSLSDVTLVSKDGRKYPAHRLVLCVQSGYFKALLGSDLWQEGTKNEVTLGSVNGAILQIMLEYMYTGKCLFPRDDLNKALELLVTAEMFLLKPMSVQCETVLCEKLTTDVVVPIYQTASLHIPKGKLHCNCCHYILMNYKDIEDPDHQILTEILENKMI